jgi:hypothetical protein
MPKPTIRSNPVGVVADSKALSQRAKKYLKRKINKLGPWKKDKHRSLFTLFYILQQYHYSIPFASYSVYCTSDPSCALSYPAVTPS